MLQPSLQTVTEDQSQQSSLPNTLEQKLEHKEHKGDPEYQNITPFSKDLKERDKIRLENEKKMQEESRKREEASKKREEESKRRK